MIWAEISFFSKWWNDIDEQKRAMVKRWLQHLHPSPLHCCFNFFSLLILTFLFCSCCHWPVYWRRGSWKWWQAGGWWPTRPTLITLRCWTSWWRDTSGCRDTSVGAAVASCREPATAFNSTFCPGVKPHSGWAVDPFGHSPSMTYLLKGVGLQNMVIQRVHYAVKKHFAQQQTLEFLWRQSWGWCGAEILKCVQTQLLGSVLNIYILCLRLLLPQWHHVPHDALLQLRRAPHVWPQPVGLLPVWLPASPREASHLSLEESAAANYGGECSGEVSGGGAKSDGSRGVNKPSGSLSTISERSSCWISTARSLVSSVLRFFWFRSVTTFGTRSRASGMCSSTTTRSSSITSTSTQNSTSKWKPETEFSLICFRRDLNAVNGCVLCLFLLLFFF